MRGYNRPEADLGRIFERSLVAYHVLIFTASTTVEPTVDLYLGSAQTVDLYWESAGREIGLPTISTITERADYEPGFCLSGKPLRDFRDELELLLKYWEQSHWGYALSSHHLKAMTTIIDTLDHESAVNATLIIC